MPSSCVCVCVVLVTCARETKESHKREPFSGNHGLPVNARLKGAAARDEIPHTVPLRIPRVRVCALPRLKPPSTMAAELYGSGRPLDSRRRPPEMWLFAGRSTPTTRICVGGCNDGGSPGVPPTDDGTECARRCCRCRSSSCPGDCPPRPFARTQRIAPLVGATLPMSDTGKSCTCPGIPPTGAEPPMPCLRCVSEEHVAPRRLPML